MRVFKDQEQVWGLEILESHENNPTSQLTQPLWNIFPFHWKLIVTSWPESCFLVMEDKSPYFSSFIPRLKMEARALREGNNLLLKVQTFAGQMKPIQQAAMSHRPSTPF